MSYLYTWLGLVIGTLIYCLFRPGYMSAHEIAAAIYFSGLALLVHWLAHKMAAAPVGSMKENERGN